MDRKPESQQGTDKPIKEAVSGEAPPAEEEDREWEFPSSPPPIPQDQKTYGDRYADWVSGNGGYLYETEEGRAEVGEFERDLEDYKRHVDVSGLLPLPIHRHSGEEMSDPAIGTADEQLPVKPTNWKLRIFPPPSDEPGSPRRP